MKEERALLSRVYLNTMKTRMLVNCDEDAVSATHENLLCVIPRPGTQDVTLCLLSTPSSSLLGVSCGWL